MICSSNDISKFYDKYCKLRLKMIPYYVDFVLIIEITISMNIVNDKVFEFNRI